MEAFFETPLGSAKLTANSNGISTFSISEKNQNSSDKVPAELTDAVSQIQKYFEGELREFQLKFSPEGTSFQKKVWKELQNISYGKTLSYQELAIVIGDVKAIRAVASANSKNPLWILIPCHRVIGKNGSLTGYAGGLWRKEWLLQHENSLKQQRLFQ